ncbi:MAG: chromosome segregation protein SMC [Pseudomonadota bacterium]
MRFSKLRLNGFKSFVDPTDLVIADGLTGVVGPNGCGKSNLLEALRWVMGENRAKAMRGSGMEDVIFAGTATRGARNFAEVHLTIDNGERLAPAGFNDSDNLDIVRRITRDIGSAYKVNTKDVRARDVQMLFADASTGAHSPALVRQGQISELINAKPKARRKVLEEAAGISGLYQRRHEAELKLNGAETNLARVDDVTEQLASQLGSLARQAKQAARYREIGAELRQSEGLFLYSRWKEADAAHAGARDVLKAAVVQASEAERVAREAMRSRADKEEGLPPLREEEAVAGAILQRVRVENEALGEEEARALALIETLTARLEQLGADQAREAALNTDASETIKQLSWEADEVEKARAADGARVAEASALASEAATVLQDRETVLGELTEDVARLAARHQSAQRLLEDTQRGLAQLEAQISKAETDRAQALETAARLEADVAEARAQEATAIEAVTVADTALSAAEAARDEALAKESKARATRSEAEGGLSALSAEYSALKALVDRASRDVDHILERVSVEAGYELALGAALSNDLKLGEVDGDDASGWAALPDYAEPQALPDGISPLSGFVKAPAALSRRLAQIGVVEASAGAGLHADLQPGQRLVSLQGDLWRWDGVRQAAGDAPSEAALQLQQRNRLADLLQRMTLAKGVAEDARENHKAAEGALRAASEADASARQARRTAEQNVATANRALSRSEAERSIASGKTESLELTLKRLGDEATEARGRVKEAQAGVANLPDLEAARAEVEDVKTTVEAARMTMMAKRSAHDEARRESEARVSRLQEITKEKAMWAHRLETAEKRAAELEERHGRTSLELKEARAVPGALEVRAGELGAALKEAEARQAQASDMLSAAEGALRTATADERDAERTASEARETRARAEAQSEAAAGSVEEAAARIMEDMSVTPEALLAQLDTDPGKMADASRIEADVARLKRQRDALGAVNLRAEEDAREVQEEHDALEAEKADLEEAIKTLRSGISSLNREGRQRLLSAFDEVNKNFSLLFTHLFGGGEARLVLVESDDPLEAGLEIMCQPPGKKLSTLSLLSGGEQTLTALALIFAVFLANPAPICVLDEVDAPLDDANVTRFCDLLDEMTRRTDTRFLIITHHAVTMSRMDRLFGVTMGEQGVSQLVSVDLKKAEALVA